MKARRKRQREESRRQAQDAYLEAHQKARSQVERIGELLFDLPAPDVDEYPINWADVGSLAEINNLLGRVVEFMEGTVE